MNISRIESLKRNAGVHEVAMVRERERERFEGLELGNLVLWDDGTV